MSGSKYELAVDRRALKFLKSIKRGDPKSARLIVERLQALASDPFPRSSLQLSDRQLEGMRVRRLRSGSYRVLYLVDESQRQVRILDIDHRRSIYRDLT